MELVINKSYGFVSALTMTYGCKLRMHVIMLPSSDFAITHYGMSQLNSKYGFIKCKSDMLQICLLTY